MRRLAQPPTVATGGWHNRLYKAKKRDHVFCHSFHRRAREYDPAGCARVDAMESRFAAPARDPPCLAGGVCSALGTGVRFEGPIHRQLCSCASAQCRRGGGGAFLPIAEGRPSHRQQHQARCRGLRNCNATGYGLFEFDKHFPAQLSGGMQQRVGLARVLVNRPRVMLMDEPFSSLDAQTRLMMQELLLNVWGEYRMTVLFVTHDIDEAVYLGSRVAVLTRRPGRLKALLDVDLPRPRNIDVLVSKEFMKLKRSCMDLVREETLGLQWRKEKPASEADVCGEAFLAESTSAAA